MARQTTRRRPCSGLSPGRVALVAGVSAVALAATVLCKAWPL